MPAGDPPMFAAYMIPPPTWTEPQTAWPKFEPVNIPFVQTDFTISDPRVDALMERICALENEVAALKAKKPKKKAKK